jgi:hypothetical protein
MPDLITPATNTPAFYETRTIWVRVGNNWNANGDPFTPGKFPFWLQTGLDPLDADKVSLRKPGDPIQELPVITGDLMDPRVLAVQITREDGSTTTGAAVVADTLRLVDALKGGIPALPVPEPG